MGVVVVWCDGGGGGEMKRGRWCSMAHTVMLPSQTDLLKAFLNFEEKAKHIP